MTTETLLGTGGNRQARGHYGMALGWLKRHRVKQAIINLEKSLEADPTYLDAYLELGRVLFAQRRWSDLAALCRRGLKYYIEVPELHKLMITALTEHGSAEDADACYHLERRDGRCLDIGPDEILCCVAVRNERVRLPYLLDYYRRLGVDRFFFIDNGSSDGTPDWLLEQRDVHLWHSDLSFKRANFGSAWFELLLGRHGVGHWCLTIDADEFLLYEGAPERSLRQFCSDLDRRGQQAVTGVLLDMYSDRPIRETRYHAGDDPRALCPFFDRAFYHTRYERGGQYRNQTIFFGGVRQRVFPAKNDYLLSKAVLLRYAADVVLTSGQHLTNIPERRLAHQYACLLHYKFFASFVDYARTEAAREIHAMAGQQYKAYDREISRQHDLVLYDSSESVRFEDTEQLRELGVLLSETPLPAARIPAIAAVTIAEKERPFWSVMVTVYDRVHNIERVLGNLLAQADPEIQIEVVCDGSDRERQRVVAAEVRRVAGERVQFHATERQLGHPHIFNRCIERATGHWVHILHDDDWVEPGFYAAMRAVISEHPEAGAAFCQHRIASQGATGPVVWDSWVERETPGIIDDWLARIALECRVQFSAMTVRRTVYEALGGFCADARSAFDWEMWIRVAARHPVCYLPEVLIGVGRDDYAESSRLLRSGKQVTDALAAIEVATLHLPPERATALACKARERIAAYALDVAQQYLDKHDLGPALANLRAAVAGRPSAATLQRLTGVLQGSIVASEVEPTDEPRVESSTRAVATSLMLGRASLERGHTQAAADHLEQALALGPTDPEVHRWLAYLGLHQENFEAAITHIERACENATANSPLLREAALLAGLAGRPRPPAQLPDQHGGRLRFSGRWERNHHRSGWRYAMEALHGLHHRDGVLFEGFLEEPFAWQHPRAGIRPGPELLSAVRQPTYATRLSSEELRVLPYREPWVGFLHNPPNMPRWFRWQESPQAILAKPIWQESLRHCIGLFTLSEQAAVWLRQATGKPVSALLHPTQTPTLLFEFERFLANPRKRIVQVGWWLRRLSAIERLPIAANNPLGYTKLRLVPNFFPGAPSYLRRLIADEYARDGQPDAVAVANTETRQHLPDGEYDTLLAENIVFIDLYDASANNAVIECLVRGTPLLVNRLPAVEEYLGSGYPLYYTDLADAAAKALDLGRLSAGHDWLMACETRERLDAASFLRAFEQSEVYGMLS